MSALFSTVPVPLNWAAELSDTFAEIDTDGNVVFDVTLTILKTSETIWLQQARMHLDMHLEIKAFVAIG